MISRAIWCKYSLYGLSVRYLFECVFYSRQKSLAFNPAMLRPGAAPPKKEAPATVASFDEPAKVTTLESTNKVRLNQLILLFS